MSLEEFSEEIEQLTQNITDENPCGINIKNTELFEKLQSLRLADDTSIPQGEWAAEAKPPQWKEMALFCRDILKNSSKDLQVLGFLVEAELHLRSFKGMAFGLLLFKEMIEKFWDQIYPHLNPDLPELRTAPFRWLERNISLLLSQESLSERTKPQSEQHSLNAFEAAQAISGEQGVKLRSKMIDSLASENLNWLEVQMSYLNSSLECLDAIGEKIAMVEGLEEEVGLTLFHSTIDKILAFFKEALPKAQERAAAQSSANQDNISSDQQDFEGGKADNESGSFGKNGRAGGLSFPPIRSREDAYKIIEFVNEELLKLEPHSPSPYLIRRALDWKSKSMYELFLDIFSSVQTPAEIFNLLGLKGEEKDERQQEQ
ncbi:MAG: type VI secretion system protein TssA [Silvanigrellaceae bacterium]|nr:type VI secretion system protein TssA [Silvanigrellaceae bacterium]